MFFSIEIRNLILPLTFLLQFVIHAIIKMHNHVLLLSVLAFEFAPRTEMAVYTTDYTLRRNSEIRFASTDIESAQRQREAKTRIGSYLSPGIYLVVTTARRTASGKRILTVQGLRQGSDKGNLGISSYCVLEYTAISVEVVVSLVTKVWSFWLKYTRYNNWRL